LAIAVATLAVIKPAENQMGSFTHEVFNKIKTALQQKMNLR